MAVAGALGRLNGKLRFACRPIERCADADERGIEEHAALK